MSLYVGSKNSDILYVQAAPQDSSFIQSRSSLLLKERSSLGHKEISLKFLWKQDHCPSLRRREQGPGEGQEGSLSFGVCWAYSRTSG